MNCVFGSDEKENFKYSSAIDAFYFQTPTKKKQFKPVISFEKSYLM